jgi:parallel beta-helix repeat protein
MLGLAFGAVHVEASPGTIVVPDDQPTIQQAIDAASSGDTVYVRAGTYYEHATIDKSLILQGENTDTTIIDGSGDGIVIYVEADHVTIDGLTVVNGTNGIRVRQSEAVVITNNRFSQHYEVAVGLSDSSNVTLGSNKIHDSQFGASTSNVSNTLIADNEVYHNDLAGIYTSNSYELVIAGNEVHDHSGLEGGIRVSWGSDGVTVERNSVYANRRGIALANDAANSIVRDNIVWENDEGIYGSTSCRDNAIYHNDLVDNTVQAWTGNSRNTWDDGYPSGGNYWSDYAGVDNFSGAGQNVPGGDGMGDTPYTFSGDQDNYPLMEARRIKTVTTATGTGDACLTTSDGTIENLQAVPAPTPQPHGIQFPHGMFTFEITGLTPGQSVTLTVEFPDPIPTRWVWWKHHNSTWSRIPITRTADPRVIEFMLTDGVYPGDEDSIAGQITDQGGPGSPGSVGWETYSIGKARVLLPWIALGAVIVAGGSAFVLRRRRAQSQIV